MLIQNYEAYRTLGIRNALYFNEKKKQFAMFVKLCKITLLLTHLTIDCDYC